MTASTTSTRRRVAQHDCAEHGCLAAMLGVELIDAADGTTEKGASSSR